MLKEKVIKTSNLLESLTVNKREKNNVLRENNKKKSSKFIKDMTTQERWIPKQDKWNEIHNFTPHSEKTGLQAQKISLQCFGICLCINSKNIPNLRDSDVALWMDAL